MAGFDDFLRQRLANTNRGYALDTNGTPVLPPQIQPITTIPTQPTPMPLPTPMSVSGGVGGPATLAAGGGTRPPGVKNPYPVTGDGTGGPMYRDTEEQLALFMWLLQQGGYPLHDQTTGSNMPTNLVPEGANPGANPNPRMDLIGVPGVGASQPSSPSRSGLDSLIADAKAARQDGHYEDGSSDPSYRMSTPLGPSGPSKRDGVDRLIRETKWAQMYPGLSLGMNPVQMPSVSPAGAIPGVNPIPNPTIPHVPVNTSGPQQAPANPQSGLDALIANAKQGGGGSQPSTGSTQQRGPMNPMQQAAMIALAKIKGMQ